MDTSLSEQLLPFFRPNVDPLSNDQLLSALKHKLIAYPEVVRSLNDPSSGEFVLLSFLKTPEHSYVKVRGYGTLNECTEKAKTIVKTVDSRFPVAIAKLGQWAYVTSDPEKVSKETVNVIDKKEITHSEHIDLLTTEHSAHKSKIEKEKEVEIQNRTDSFKNEEKTSLESFVLYKVKVYETYKQIQFLEKKLALLKERQSLLKRVIDDSPQYETGWLEEYTKQLERVGIKHSAITEDSIRTALEIELPAISDDVEAKKKLEEVENEYNGLRYAAII